MDNLINKIDSILPQFQCQKCGYKDCKSYAEAINFGERHNRCTPGGTEGIKLLSKLLNREELDLNLDCREFTPNIIAKIDENLCVGCEKCLDVCPTDAIVGSKKLMHDIIEEDCSGCELCIDPCPMNCIEMKKSDRKYEHETSFLRKKYIAKTKRLQARKNEYSNNNEIVKNKIKDKKRYIGTILSQYKERKLIK